MVSHNIEQIPKQQCQLFLVQTTLLRAVVDYESYKFYKYSCKILRYYILEGMGAGRGGAPRKGDLLHNINVIKLIIMWHTA